MNARWALFLVVTSACADPLGALLPRCRASSECPDGYVCDQATCVRGSASSSSGTVPSSSSLVPASSLGTSSSSAMASSTGSSSSSAPSSSGPLCAAFANNAFEVAAPFSTGQDFDATLCRDQTSNTFYWRSEELVARAGTAFTLHVERDVGDAGLVEHRVGFNLGAPVDGGVVDYAFQPACNSAAQPFEDCTVTTGEYQTGLFVRAAPLDDNDRGYTHHSTLRVQSRGPCAMEPGNTSYMTRGGYLLGFGSGPICASGVTYFWDSPCGPFNPACTLDVIALDREHRATPLEIVADTATDGGTLEVPCPDVDGGVYVCEGLAWGGAGSVQSLRIRALTDGGTGPLPSSEYVRIHVH